ncbi:VCBS repeat-containing protein [Deminuibacter soli]|uniref:VCBS repeat-containing protein n=1 Tax=Deminuibacter soli TaxID=2291815 RepID=UPI001FE28E64|nr:VCBS repeat-containing protein [Deminuibacter soli]
MKRLTFLCVTAWLLSLYACSNNSHQAADADTVHLFTLLTPEQTHVDFANTLTEGINTNVLLYEYFYNGGGVAAGDVNNDGLQDLYFSGNMTDNKLYLNKGNMQFADITAAAGVAGRPGPWKTGVTMADVNGDGKTDIFVCYSGKVRGEKRVHQLFINNGNDAAGTPHFTEQAAQYGLADSAYSTQAFFFDYDRDGDLDAFMLNHNPSSLRVLDEAATAALLKEDDLNSGLRLYRNDHNHFTDVTRQSGIQSSALSYGLGAGIADINGDGWPDIYVSNDYTVPDYLYINNHNGTFTDKLQQTVGHTSQFSMGNDVADINNDGLPDIYTLDMLPEDNHRQKLLTAPDNYEKFELNLRTGFYYQYMRNMLQVNNGDGSFSETGQFSGISNTDWSWAPLFADFDNDGLKDLFVSNGFTRDYTNLDFVKYMNDYVQGRGHMSRADVLELLKHIPSSNVVNYLYKNNGNLKFSNASRQWGMQLPSNSNGAAYADLDNDGDLDLVINNINQPAFIYRNDADKQLHHHYLDVQLKGAGANTQGLGSKLRLWAGGQQQLLEQMPARGYQSTVSPVLHFGLGKVATIDSLQVQWPNGKTQLLRAPKPDQLLALKETDALTTATTQQVVRAVYKQVAAPVAYAPPTDAINDFKRQPLLINPLSFNGPCMAKADVNGDKLEDIYIGGGSGNAGILYLQQANGSFKRQPQPAFEAAHAQEDAAAVFFDANGDGYADLYVASGGYHNYIPGDTLLQDRLYLNNGKGQFTQNNTALPAMYSAKSCVAAADVNGDGFTDLFVGARVIPGRYPETPESYLLLNNGKGQFTNAIATIAPALQKAGMITDAAFTDLNNDKLPDLVVAGEWMPVSIFINRNKQLQNSTSQYFTEPLSGWWNKLLVTDINNDGHPDLVIGNQGLNTQCRASTKEPAELYYKDFDDNGAIDPILCFYIQGKTYPYVTRDELLDQMSMMRTRFTGYAAFADATLTDVFTADELKGAGHLQANTLATTCLLNNGKGGFTQVTLPVQAQLSPVFTITALDYDNDGKQDLLLCGNCNHARLRFGKYDANYGVLLHGDGKGGFTYINQPQSGFHLKGDVRSVLNLGNLLLFGINHQPLTAYSIQHD